MATHDGQASATAKTPELLLQLVVEKAALVAWSTDRELRITSFRAQTRGAAGKPPEHRRGMTLSTLFQADASDSQPVAVHRRALGGESGSFRFDWEGMPYRADVFPHKNEEGHVVGCLGFAQAITERKLAKESLRVAYRFLDLANQCTEFRPLLEEFVDHVQDFTGCAGVGIRVLDEKGNIPYEAYCGFDQRFYEAESPLSIKSDQCMCINVIEGTTDPELPFYTKGGSFYTNGTTRLLAPVSEEEKGRTRNVCNEVGYESVALVPIRLGDRVLGLIHIADPQENMVPLESVLVLEGAAMQLGTAIQRVRAEEATRQAQEKLLDQQRHETERVETELGKVREELVRKTQLAAIGQVSASIAHDLRNPLGSVRNAAYYLKRILPKEDPQIAEFLGVIEEEVQAADRIIGGLLGMTQGREPGKQTVNLARLVTEVLNRRDLRGAVRCRITTDPDPFEVSADPGQLRQLIGNLLENAIDTMGGHGEFIVEAARSAAYDTILVRDTGPGVALGVRENLFEPLVSTKAKGIGLGLAICRQIAESHGGTIDVAHHEGPGAAFEIRLPR